MWSKLFTFSLLLALGTSAISLVLFLLNLHAEWHIYSLLGASIVQKGRSYEANAPEPTQLFRPNVYIGLDKLPLDVQQSTLPESLDVFPSFFQPVDQVDDDFVFPHDEHARFSFNGRVSPGDHRVLLNDDVTMIAQFRVHDYGMERCRIVSSVPSLDALPKNQSLLLSGDTSVIEIWNLTTPTASHSELDVRTLSWNTKPSRAGLLATIGAAVNSTMKSDEFWCGPSSSLQTFELACRSPGCHVEFFQDIYFRPRLGIFVQQSPSL